MFRGSATRYSFVATFSSIADCRAGRVMGALGLEHECLPRLLGCAIGQGRSLERTGRFLNGGVGSVDTCAGAGEQHFESCYMDSNLG